MRKREATRSVIVAFLAPSVDANLPYNSLRPSQAVAGAVRHLGRVEFHNGYQKGVRLVGVFVDEEVSGYLQLASEAMHAEHPFPAQCTNL